MNRAGAAPVAPGVAERAGAGVGGLTERERLVLAVYLSWLRGEPVAGHPLPAWARRRGCLPATIEAGQLLERKAWAAARAAGACPVGRRALREVWTVADGARLEAALARLAGLAGSGFCQDEARASP